MGNRRQRQPWVGSIYADQERTLGETTHRDLTALNKEIEHFDQTVLPPQALASQYSPFQVPQPVALPGTGHSAKPSTGSKSVVNP